MEYPICTTAESLKEEIGDLRDELRRPLEHLGRVRVAPIGCRLRRPSCVLEPEPVVVGTGCVPRHVGVVHGLHDQANHQWEMWLLRKMLSRRT